MPRIRTDDGPRKLRAVWLGPKGATLPFEWTFVQWAVTLLISIAASVVMAGVWWVLSADPLVSIILGGLWGAAGGVWLAVRIMRHVTFDEPVRYKLARLRSQLGWRDQRRFPADVVVEWAAPRAGEVSPMVGNRLGWRVDHG